MLKLNKLESGIFAEAQMQGMRVLHFDFTEDDADYEKGDNGQPTEESLVKNCEEILNEAKSQLEAKGLEEDWVNLLLAQEYGIFTGDEIASPKNVDAIITLFVMLSHMSHDLQKDQPVEFRKRPPMFVYYGIPKYATGQRQFYENFNVVFCNVDPNKLPDNMFAMLEMLNHTFCTVQAKCKNADDVNNFYNNYIANDNVKSDPNRTIALIVGKANEIVERSIDLGVRCNIPIYAKLTGAKDPIITK